MIRLYCIVIRGHTIALAAGLGAVRSNVARGGGVFVVLFGRYLHRKIVNVVH